MASSIKRWQMLPRAESVEHAATALCLYLYLHLSLSRAQRERAERFIPPVLNWNNELSLEPEPDATFSRAPIRSITQPCPSTPLSMLDRSSRRPNERVVVTGAMPRATRGWRVIRSAAAAMCSQGFVTERYATDALNVLAPRLDRAPSRSRLSQSRTSRPSRSQ